MRRGVAVLLAVVVLVTALVIAGIAVGVRFAPGSREQAELAELDTVWTHVPSAMPETSRFTVLGDADWVPDLGSKRLSSANVGRYYRSSESHSEALARWDRAAAAAGWRLVSSSCVVPGDPEAHYEKLLGRWSASLTTSFVLADTLLVVIGFPRVVPATPATTAAGIRACK